jgi:hypothetical protein
MIGRLSETERTMALQRLEEANERIAALQAGIRRPREQGQPIVEAERLLRLMRRSRGVMRRHLNLIARDQEEQDGAD